MRTTSLTILSIIALISSVSYYHGSSNKSTMRHLLKKNLRNLPTFRNAKLTTRIVQEAEGEAEGEEQMEEGEHEEHEHEEHEHEGHGGHEEKIPFGTPKFFAFIGIALFLVCYAGIMSGLTVGFMGIPIMELEIKLETGDEETKRQARKILPILRQHHLLLVTLLLNNAVAMEALPIFLDALVPSWAAIMISTTLVLLFGEVFPQALCTGENQIKIAAFLAPFINVLMKVFCCLSVPISKCLDYFLGVHGVDRFRKKDLKALIGIHLANEHNKDGLTTDEVKMIQSVIDIRELRVAEIMVKIEDIVMVPNNKKITERLIKKIAQCGYSRIPVYTDSDKNKIYGALVTKSLLGAKEEIGKELRESSCNIEPPLVVYKDTNLLEMLTLFQQKRTRIAMVTQEEKPKKKDQEKKLTDSIMNIEFKRTKIVGLVAQTDLFEKLIKVQLTDADIHQKFNLMSVGGDNLKMYNSLAVQDRLRNQKLQEADEEEEFEMQEVGNNLNKPLVGR